ncbi:hypothetical protein CU097_005998 [Rhizopus azygosporus]|uniref:glycogenin glucosyltransferase n=1 Tax=Rhizopus azygosporus TaxID=86630 RepID=A0A367JG66_RHIAZ|nr:hypothetical protein CU097_005998 [Rhizopus azygosporus]
MEAFVTLVATDSYASGALVIAHRLRDLGSRKELLCLVTPNISTHVQNMLSKYYKTIPVETIRSKDHQNLLLLGRPDLDISLTKIHLWRLTQYKKIVFLDADTLPLQNIDELFDRPSFSAAPDAGWPDCFNSGVFVAEPSESIYQDLVRLAAETGSFDGGDQGLLNTYFSSWPDSSSHRLPFTFNATPTAQYGYAPAQVQYGQSIKIAHFIGQNKPWKYQRFADGKVLPMGDAWEGTSRMVQTWWDTWDKYYGRISPYQLLSFGISTFDTGFQTRPIVPFNEAIENAWENERYDLDHSRRQVKPMPTLSAITVSQPSWLQEELRAIAENEQRQLQQMYLQNKRPKQQYHDEREPYSMIKWDPAYEEPPSSGSLGADIPDLSSYRNVWDQPLENQQHVWVAPVFQPEPEILKKPEYAQFVEAQQTSQEQEQNDEHNDGKEQGRSQEGEHRYHQKTHDNNNNSEQQNQNKPEVSHPIAFPWEANPHHFPAPTRVWQDEMIRQDNSADRKNESRYEQHEEYHNRHLEHKQHEQHGQERYYHYEEHQPQTYHQEPSETIHSQDTLEQAHGQLDAYQETTPSHTLTERVPEENHNQHEQLNVKHASEKEREQTEVSAYHQHDETNRQIEIEQEEATEEEHKQAPLFAIDEILSPSVKTKIDEFIAELHKDEEDDISDRDLIPINFKASSRLHSGMYTPLPLGSRNGSRVGSRTVSRSGSRRASIVSSRRNSVPGTPKKSHVALDISVPTLVDDSIPNIDQPSNLFADFSSSIFNRKTPYTSAAATPAVALTPDAEQSEYFGHIGETLSDNEDEGFDNDSFEMTNYDLSDSLDVACHSKDTVTKWNPLEALENLKSQSESMILRKTLTEALTKAAKEQEELERLEQLEPAEEKPKRVQRFRSAWDMDDDTELGLPSALASGQSSPRTPMMRGLSDNLSREIEQEKERYRQQRESLSMAQPQTAIASLLEAELDLSRGTLFKKKYELQHVQQMPPEVQSTPFPAPHFGQDEEEKAYTAYFSEDVIKEAKQRLDILKNDREEQMISDGTLPLPVSTGSLVDDIQFSTQPSHMYQHSKYQFSDDFDSKNYTFNFGFDEHHKLKIYQSDLIQPDILATVKPANTVEVSENPLRKAEKSDSIQTSQNEQSEKRIHSDHTIQSRQEDVPKESEQPKVHTENMIAIEKVVTAVQTEIRKEKTATATEEEITIITKDEAGSTRSITTTGQNAESSRKEVVSSEEEYVIVETDEKRQQPKQTASEEEHTETEKLKHAYVKDLRVKRVDEFEKEKQQDEQEVVENTERVREILVESTKEDDEKKSERLESEASIVNSEHTHIYELVDDETDDQAEEESIEQQESAYGGSDGQQEAFEEHLHEQYTIIDSNVVVAGNYTIDTIEVEDDDVEEQLENETLQTDVGFIEVQEDTEEAMETIEIEEDEEEQILEVDIDPLEEQRAVIKREEEFTELEDNFDEEITEECIQVDMVEEQDEKATEVIELEEESIEVETISQEANVETIEIDTSSRDVQVFTKVDASSSSNAFSPARTIITPEKSTVHHSLATSSGFIRTESHGTSTQAKDVEESLTTQVAAQIVDLPDSRFSAARTIITTTTTERSSRPTRKLSIAETLLSSPRPSVAPIVTTPVIIQTFEGKGDTPVIDHEVVNRTYALRHLKRPLYPAVLIPLDPKNHHHPLSTISVK